MLLGMLVGLAVAAAGLGGLLWGLDKPWVKRRVQALVRANVGLDIDYGTTRVRLLSGLRLDEVSLRAPARPGTTYLESARASTLEAAWTMYSLLTTRPHLTGLTVRGVELTLAMDAGEAAPQTQPDRTTAASRQPQEPTPPLSRILSGIFTGAPIVDKVLCERAAVTLKRYGSELPVEEWRLEGLAFAAQLEHRSSGWGVRATVGTEPAPAALLLTRNRGGARLGEAELLLWLRGDVSAAGAELGLDAKIARQTLVPEVRVHRALHLESRFTPGAGKSEATLLRAELADGAANLEASVELSDTYGVPPLLRRARGVIDLVGVLQVVPADLVPVQAQTARLSFDIDQLVLATVPRLASSGHVVAEATLAAARATLAGMDLSLGEGRLTLKGELARDGGMEVRLSAPMRDLRVGMRSQTLSGTAVELAGTAHLGTEGTCRGTASLRFDSFERSASERLIGRAGELTLTTDGLQLDPAAPLAARGMLELRGSIGGVTFLRRGLHLEASGVGVSARSHLLGHAPYSVAFSLPIARLQLVGARGRPLLSQPVRLGGELVDILPDLAQLRRSQGQAKLNLDVGAAQAHAVVHKRPEGLTFTLSGAAESLAFVRPLLAKGADLGVAWERVGLDLDTKGSVDKMWSTAPLLHHRTQLVLQRPQWKGGVALAAQELTLTASSSGTLRRHDGEAELQISGLSVGSRPVGDGRLTLKLAADAEAKTVRMRLGVAAQSGPDATLAATLGFDPAQRAITYDVDGRFLRLGPLKSFFSSVRALQGFELGALELGLGGSGTVSGLVAPAGPHGRLRLLPQPLVSLGVNGTLELRAQGLRWTDGDLAVATPRAAWKATISAQGTQRKVHADLELGELHVALGRHQLDFTKVSDALDLTVTGELAQGEGTLSHELTLGGLRQNFAPGYAIGAVSLTLQGRRSRDGVVRISTLRLQNPAAGTTLNLRGGFDLGDTRRSLALRGTLEQRLATLWNVRTQYVGEGTMSLSLRLESGNFSLFRVLFAVRVTDGNIRLPGQGLALDSIDGEIPIAADLILDRRGVRLLRDAARNAYSELHFADQHSLLSQRSFISIARVTTPLFTLAPLAGNLQINNNIVSLSQLELGVRGGRITGQSVLDFGEKDAAVKLHLRASNIEAGHGERFDGNTAVVISARDRSIDGRAEILRIGRGHLLALLDLHDPHHEDSAVNRIRRALSLGYPERVRLSFDHGFAAAGITFGGLAKLVRVDELRGIPTGPIIDRALRHLFSLKENGP